MSIDELNEQVLGGEFDEFVRVCEARQCKMISSVADDICARESVRIVLLAGCSSAGKTTIAKRLCTQLRVNGHYARHLSTDDYFRGSDFYPRLPDGSIDFENIVCVDREKLSKDINDLLAGETIFAHKFDFRSNRPFEDQEKTLRLPPGGVMVLEGIHALNPVLTASVPDAVKFRMFVDPKSRLEIFGPTRLPSVENRLFRRLVRDNQFRRTDPVKTLEMWPKVLEGEKLWIDPFRANVDVEFDSSLDYELAVLSRMLGDCCKKC